MTQTPLLHLFDLEYPLDQISEAKFREIAQVLEEAGSQPEIRTIMARLRPRLKRIRPARKPNLQRLFYLPFEDLLRNEPTKVDDGRIPRRAAQRAWDFVQAKNDDAERKIYRVMATRLRGLDRNVNQILSSFIRELKIKTIRLFEARTAKPAERPAIERDLFWCVRMLELSGDPEEADRIRQETMRGGRQER